MKRPVVLFLVGLVVSCYGERGANPKDETSVVLNGISRCKTGWYGCGNGFCCPEDSECCDGSNCPKGWCSYDGQWHYEFGAEPEPAQ